MRGRCDKVLDVPFRNSRKRAEKTANRSKLLDRLAHVTRASEIALM